jgi:hypothetical protein
MGDLGEQPLVFQLGFPHDDDFGHRFATEGHAHPRRSLDLVRIRRVALGIEQLAIDLAAAFEQKRLCIRWRRRQQQDSQTGKCTGKKARQSHNRPPTGFRPDQRPNSV